MSRYTDPNDFDQDREKLRVVRVEFTCGNEQGLSRVVTETPGETVEEQLEQIEYQMLELYPDRTMTIVSDTQE